MIRKESGASMQLRNGGGKIWKETAVGMQPPRRKGEMGNLTDLTDLSRKSPSRTGIAHLLQLQ
jgi:hypothetical protein